MAAHSVYFFNFKLYSWSIWMGLSYRYACCCGSEWERRHRCWSWGQSSPQQVPRSLCHPAGVGAGSQGCQPLRHNPRQRSTRQQRREAASGELIIRLFYLIKELLYLIVLHILIDKLYWILYYLRPTKLHELKQGTYRKLSPNVKENKIAHYQ